jgi:hypothetical protein
MRRDAYERPLQAIQWRFGEHLLSRDTMIVLDALVACVTESLAAITAPRFFQTERGYQGALLTQLDRRLRLPDHAIIEQEYQKQAGLHGLTIRPDIIIHEPFDPGRHAGRTEGNLAAVELKRKATPSDPASI